MLRTGHRAGTCRPTLVVLTITAREALAGWIIEQRQGMLVERSDQTVAATLAYWLDTFVATKKARTQADYCYEVEKHVLPHLGDMHVQDLEARHIIAWHATLHKAGKSSRAIRQAHLRLSQALDQAETLGIVARNAAKKVKPPTPQERPERPTWTTEEARRFLEIAREHCIYGPVFRVALATSLRRGELLGLRWQDVDTTAKVLHVRQSIGPIGNTMEAGSPKNKRSQRDVSITDALLDVLREHRRDHNARRLALGPAWHDGDLVFASGVGTAIGGSNLHREYRRLLEIADVPRISIHDERHTVISWAVAAGVDPKTGAERMGQHVSMTLGRYTHTSKKQHRDAAETLDDLLSAPRNDTDECIDAR